MSPTLYVQEFSEQLQTMHPYRNTEPNSPPPSPHESHVIKHSVKPSFCFPDSIDAVYHHNNVFSVSLFPFALPAFLKKMVENLMDVSCEEQVGIGGCIKDMWRK